MDQLGSMPSFRHYAKWNQEEVIILGYYSRMNDCIIVRVTALPVDDQMHLRQIASSSYAQKQDYLMPLLQSQMHASQYDWLRYLLSRLARNDKTVIKVPLKDLSEMNPEQKAVFGGWGKPSKPETPKSALGSPEHNSEQVAQARKIEEKERALVDLPPGIQTVGQPDGMSQIAQALGALAESQASMASTLEKLTAKVKPPRAVRKPAKRRATRRSSAKSDTSADGEVSGFGSAAPAKEPVEV